MSAETRIRVGGVPEHFNLPWHLAIEGGAFAKAGIDLHYTDFPGGTGALTGALRSNDLDLAIVLSEGCLADIVNGNPSRIVKTYVQSPLIWGIHVAKNSDLTRIDQIQGQRYAISRYGSGSHLMAIVDAAERDWPTDNLNFVPVGNLDGARAALANGEADVFFWERFTTSPLVQSNEFRRLGDRETLWPAFVVCARLEFLQQYSPEVKTTLDIINATCQRLMSDPQAVDVIAGRYELEMDQVRQWFAKTTWSTNYDQPSDALVKAIDYLTRLELISKVAVPNDVWESVNN